MVRHDVGLDEPYIHVTLLLLLELVLVVLVASRLEDRREDLLLGRWLLALSRLIIIGWLNILLLHLLWLLGLLLSSSILLLLHLLLLLYLIGGVGWILGILRLRILTSLLPFARTVLRIITCHWVLLRPLRRIVRLLCVSLMGTRLLRHIGLRACWEIAFGWQVAALIYPHLIA